MYLVIHTEKDNKQVVGVIEMTHEHGTLDSLGWLVGKILVNSEGIVHLDNFVNKKDVLGLQELCTFELDMKGLSIYDREFNKEITHLNSSNLQMCFKNAKDNDFDGTIIQLLLIAKRLILKNHLGNILIRDVPDAKNMEYMPLDQEIGMYMVPTSNSKFMNKRSYILE